MKINKDLTGQIFGRLTALSLNKEDTRCHKWVCQCSCGIVKTIAKGDLLSGDTKSCGCLKKETQGFQFKTHGKTKTSEFNTWQNMQVRCYNKSDDEYHNYGGRGITVCDEWLGKSGFETFLKDLGEKPTKVHSLDRVITNGNYCKENCRWATPKEQGRNRRTNVKIKIKDKTMILIEWSEFLNVKYDTLRYHYKRYKSIDKFYDNYLEKQNNITAPDDEITTISTDLH